MVISSRAILLGASVDLAGSYFFGSVLSLPWLYALMHSGVPQNQLYHALLTSPAFLIASFCLGSGFSFLGGYTAGSIARKGYVLNGALSAIPCVITGIFEVVSPFGTIFPGWLIWGGKAGAVLFALLGGLYAKHRHA